MHILLLIVDLGKAGTSLFGLRMLAGNQCPGRPDPGCCVPWPPNFSRALYPPPKELDREAERQWRGPRTSKWTQTWLEHLPVPHMLRGPKVHFSLKGRQGLSHWPISLSLFHQYSELWKVISLTPNQHRCAWTGAISIIPSNSHQSFNLLNTSHPMTCPRGEGCG